MLEDLLKNNESDEEPVKRKPETKKKLDYKLNDQVLLKDGRKGVIRYVGSILKKTGVFYGLELIDGTAGSHDGTAYGKRYFKCPRKKGLFTRKEKFASVIDKEERKKSVAKPVNSPSVKKKSATRKTSNQARKNSATTPARKRRTLETKKVSSPQTGGKERKRRRPSAVLNNAVIEQVLSSKGEKKGRTGKRRSSGGPSQLKRTRKRHSRTASINDVNLDVGNVGSRIMVGIRGRKHTHAVDSEKLETYFSEALEIQGKEGENDDVIVKGKNNEKCISLNTMQKYLSENSFEREINQYRIDLHSLKLDLNSGITKNEFKQILSHYQGTHDLTGRMKDIFIEDKKKKSDRDRAASAPVKPSSGIAYVVGNKIRLVDGRVGEIAYLGKVLFAEGIYYGIELDEQLGTNDGTVAGREYFFCEPLHGVFVQYESILNLEKAIPTTNSIILNTNLSSSSSPSPSSVKKLISSNNSSSRKNSKKQIKKKNNNSSSKNRTPEAKMKKSRKKIETNSTSNSETINNTEKSPTKTSSVKKASRKNSTKKQDAEEKRKNALRVGNQIIMNQGATGSIMYIGRVKFASGVWIGVKLDPPEIGEHDGEVGSTRYFTCEAKEGIFIKKKQITKKILPSGQMIAANDLAMVATTVHKQTKDDDKKDFEAIELVLSYLEDDIPLSSLFHFFDRKSRGMISSRELMYVVYIGILVFSKVKSGASFRKPQMSSISKLVRDMTRHLVKKLFGGNTTITMEHFQAYGEYLKREYSKLKEKNETSI